MILLNFDNGKYEYCNPVELYDDMARYIKLPMYLVTAKELHNNRIAIYAYISMYKGLNNRLLFSIPKFLKWSGFKSDTHSGGINEKVLNSLDRINDAGFFTYQENSSKTSPFELKVDNQFCYDISENDFSLLYIDEIEKIMRYRRANPKDTHLNSFSILLVFAYLRRNIFRRPNKLKPEECSQDKIIDRQKRCPEAYATLYINIASELGLSERTVSESVKILVDLNLIVIREAYHIKDDKGNYHTPYTMFANYEKREGKYLLDYGLRYAYSEMERKAKQIDKNSVKGYKLKNI